MIQRLLCVVDIHLWTIWGETTTGISPVTNNPYHFERVVCVCCKKRATRRLVREVIPWTKAKSCEEETVYRIVRDW
jgi:hypothetical protein